MPELSINPGKWVDDPEDKDGRRWDGYFLPKQEEYVWTPDDRRTLDIAAYIGGVGSGKTWASARKGYLLSQVYPGSRGLVAGEDYPLVRDTTLGGPGGWLDFMENEVGLKEGRHFDLNRTEHKLVFPNKSEVLFRGLRDVNKIKSLTLTWAHIEEMSDVTLDAFLMVLARLRQAPPAGWVGPWRHFLFGSTNPEEAAGWVDDLFVNHELGDDISEAQRKALEKVLGVVRCVNAPTTENTRLPEGFVDTLTALGDEAWAQTYVHGKTGVKKGRVYRAFSRDTHIDKDGEIAFWHEDLPLLLALDFNVNPMTGTVSQILRDKTLITIDEFWIEHGTTEDLCKEFKRRWWDKAAGERTDRSTIEGGQRLIVYGDAAGNSRTTKVAESDYDIIRRELRHWPRGMTLRVPDANPPIKDRVNAVNAKLRNGKGEVTWYIAPKCKRLIRDLDRVRWREGVTEFDKKSDPTLTHVSDGVGYLIHHEFPIKPKADYSRGAKTTGQRASTGGSYGYDS